MANITWVVRAGRNAFLIEKFREKSVVALGWGRLCDVISLKTRNEIFQRLKGNYPDCESRKLKIAAGKLWRFIHEIKLGDGVLTYDPSQRRYIVGNIDGIAIYDESIVDENHGLYRKVKWLGEVGRDKLSVSSKNTLGATMALFRVNQDVASELDRCIRGNVQDGEDITCEEEQEEEVALLRREVVERGHEFIKDRVQALEWDEMQELVAAVLRALGYRTRISPVGPDRGKDIVASKDGLGLEPPRILVEVKHRKGTAMSAANIRSFLGGMRGTDKGLYVSTGGYTKDARYEAERANVPVTLLDLDDLVDLFVQHYDDMDAEGKALVPLVRVYWPAST